MPSFLAAKEAFEVPQPSVLLSRYNHSSYHLDGTIPQTGQCNNGFLRARRELDSLFPNCRHLYRPSPLYWHLSFSRGSSGLTQALFPYCSSLGRRDVRPHQLSFLSDTNILFRVIAVSLALPFPPPVGSIFLSHGLHLLATSRKSLQPFSPPV